MHNAETHHKLNQLPRQEGNATGIILVPEQYALEIQRRICAIREKDDPKRLEYDCEQLKQEIINEFGVATTKSSLVCGKRYAVIGYSRMATAIRNGKCIPYHGEIYLYLWTYAEDGKFYTKNGWGVVRDSKLPGTPLIEFS